MLRYFFIGFALFVLLLVSMTGLRGWKSKRPPLEIFPDMVRQPKYKAQTQSDFYANNRSARDHVSGTVPLGYTMPREKTNNSSSEKANDLEAAANSFSGSSQKITPYQNIQFSKGDSYLETGRMGNQWGTGIPFEATPAIMKRGAERFAINCAVCHGATGVGNGITSKYGLNGIANLHQQRLRDMADGEIFNTITWGKNTMMGYGSNIQVPDRWAIICYLRALQRSQNATMADLPAEEQAKFSTPVVLK